MAGISFTNQYSEYPLYLVEVSLDGANENVAFWIGNFSGFPAANSYPCYQAPSFANPDIMDIGPAFYEGGSSAVASLLEAVKTWAEGYDWSTLTGYAYSSLTATEFSETSANVTPS
jgi:hypothetical protein